ncbi:MAG: NotI family restriction endonuclease [Alphaproteobacteria bacterium]|nr:NotI family restriction endonuclease [Alphaproteobacteria bacterium]
METKPKDYSPRFGIGEWFGWNLAELTVEERRSFAQDVLKSKIHRNLHPCPFQIKTKDAACTKEGGVCSLRLYTYNRINQQSLPIQGKQGDLRITCPYRFHENSEIFKWVGETILGDSDPLLIGEIGFLESNNTSESQADDVGRIDMVIVSQKNSAAGSLAWAAVEIQAVYFSGSAMKVEFESYKDSNESNVLFPIGRRRPDYRSSGPKRLMPQLQIKVPTLRRWAKKMAVVVDRAFFDSIGEMDHVADISNADIAWFIVNFEELIGKKRFRLVPDEVRFTTLERSVEGLTGGHPVALPVFEKRIKAKLASKL